jgi:heme/copper-type cytochrome/quinol oxidase subunit 2
MSNQSRIAALAAAVVVVVVAFFVLAPKNDDSSSQSGSTATTQTGPVTTPTTTAEAPAASYEVVSVRGGKPVGGIKRITLKKGDRARIEVSSPDTSDEIHIHGYDLMQDLKAGGRVRFSFDAKSDGVYEIELEGAGRQIAELVVEP